MSINKFPSIFAFVLNERERFALPEAPTPHRHVETYLGVFVGERLRQRLEDFLGGHEALDEETAYALLLDLGLTKAEDEPDAVDPKAVQADLKSELTGAASTTRDRRLKRLAQIRALSRESRDR
jgi:hypothetical protein